MHFENSVCIISGQTIWLWSDLKPPWHQRNLLEGTNSAAFCHLANTDQQDGWDTFSEMRKGCAERKMWYWLLSCSASGKGVVAKMVTAAQCPSLEGGSRQQNKFLQHFKTNQTLVPCLFQSFSLSNKQERWKVEIHKVELSQQGGSFYFAWRQDVDANTWEQSF